MNTAQATEQALQAVKAARGMPNDELAKAWTQSGSAISGITAYDLEAPAKNLYPVLTPLRNSIPRVGGGAGIQANWRAITGINTTGVSPGVSEGNRGGGITSTTADYTAVYKELGLEDSVTWKADLAAKGFDDLKAVAALGLLRSMMIAEERTDLGGNTSLALGNTPTLTLSQANTGGTLQANTSFGVVCVALSFDGYFRASVSGGVVQSYVRTNTDSSTDTVNGGAANPSAQANVSTANDGNNTHTISASCNAVAGAVAYAWYWGLASNSNAQFLGAITTINSVLITANATGTQAAGTLTASDKSTDSLVYDGLLTIASNSSLNSYRAAQATGTPGTGTPLTGDNIGGIVEIDRALKSFWDNYRLSPEILWVSSQEMQNIASKILAANSSVAQRFMFTAEQGLLGGGVMVRTYLNKFSMAGAKELKIMIHPNMPAGTMLFDTDTIPYPLSNVTNVKQKKLRRDYFQIEWPMRTRKYEYGVYMDGVLQHYFPPSIGVITNIGNG